MRNRVLLPVLAVAVVLVAGSCQTGVTMWASCQPAADGDPTGTDGTHVLVCVSGRWEPIMTVDEFVARAQGSDVAIAPLPMPPTSSTTSTTSTTTTTTSTTTTPIDQGDCDAPAAAGVDWHNCDKSGADLRFVDLSGANLSGADLRDTTVWNADLSGADLSDAILFGANLTGSDLTGVDLSGAFLSRAILLDTTGVPADANGIYFNTACPDGNYVSSPGTCVFFASTGP